MFSRDYSEEFRALDKHITVINETLKKMETDMKQLEKDNYLIEFKFENLKNNVQNVLQNAVQSHELMSKLLNKEN